LTHHASGSRIFGCGRAALGSGLEEFAQEPQSDRGVVNISKSSRVELLRLSVCGPSTVYLVPQPLDTSQELIRDEFSDQLFAAGIPRMWKPSAYIGTYGDLSNGQIRAYVRGWEKKGGGPSGSSARHPRRLPARYLRLARYEQATTPTRNIPAACRRGT
jgi:hypothetical protein